MREKKVVLHGFYNLGGEHVPFGDNPHHGKTYNNVNVTFTEKIRRCGGKSYVVDVVNIEGCDPIECELVGRHKDPDGTLVISICQDWG